MGRMKLELKILHYFFFFIIVEFLLNKLYFFLTNWPELMVAL